MKPVHVLSLRWVLILAFAAMFAQDVLGTVMVIFEAHYHAAWAAATDEAQWMTGLVTSALAIGSILERGWRSRRSVAIITAISAANIAGTYSGVAIGHALAGAHP